MKLDGKVGSTSDLVLVEEGNGGAAEIVQFLKDKKKEMYALSPFVWFITIWKCDGMYFGHYMVMV